MKLNKLQKNCKEKLRLDSNIESKSSNITFTARRIKWRLQSRSGDIFFLLLVLFSQVGIKITKKETCYISVSYKTSMASSSMHILQDILARKVWTSTQAKALLISYINKYI